MYIGFIDARENSRYNVNCTNKYSGKKAKQLARIAAEARQRQARQ
jgi:hypothetical protein